ncbi:MAG TPA: hypothetical protein VN285_03615 [Candidatus Deferrimicrobium sp.]|nr:hypothetical protein [Candidatus Deferrimicrobium sp.]
MGRIITTSRHGSPDTMIVHFSWMYMPNRDLFGRQYRYDSWNAARGGFGTEVGLQPSDDWGGYVGVDAASDGRAIVGGQNRQAIDGSTDCHFYWDSNPGQSNFTAQAQVPRNVTEYGGYSGQKVVWPKFRYQEGPVDTVLHVLALEAHESTGDPQRLYYFRKVGAGAGGVWTYPPYIVDTVYTPAHDLDAAGSGKVALVWTANRPCPGSPCDTCSGYECLSFPVRDNDLYCQISNDNGAHWQPRLNVTRNVDGQQGFRPFADVSALITANGMLHIVWGARSWPADANSGGETNSRRGRICHWSEDYPTVRTVHAFEWDQTGCNGGMWQLNAAKMSVSECNGKLYVLFVQFNDVPGGVSDDCAAAYSPAYPDGAANGDLYVTISADGGLTWDKARNLTNSHSPGCDSIGGVGGPCENDHWPSMATVGTNYAGNFGGAPIVVPSGSTDPGSYYLDVQYVNDRSAGAAEFGEGFWEQADVRWFRLACVDPVPEPLIDFSPAQIAYPEWTPHGMQENIACIVTNAGNSVLNYAISKQEITGPGGWLSYSGLSGSLPSGVDSADTGAVHLNVGGVVNNPGTVVRLLGRIIFTSNADSSPDTLPIDVLVADTLYQPLWETISTPCLALTVSNTGNFGHQGIGKVNLDYVTHGDCDSTARVYLSDGSPVVTYVQGGDTVANFSMFATTFVDDNGLVPMGNHTPTADSGSYDVFGSGKFATHDSLITLEKTWYAPRSSDSCNFVIECLTIYLARDTTLTGVRLGEAIDWDIPSDSGVENGSGYDDARFLVYQVGAEYNQDGGTECQDNNRRFGGLAFIDRFINGTRQPDPPYGAYTADNATYVLPTQSFVPEQLYYRMGVSGYALFSSPHPDSQYVDLHTVMTFDTGVTLSTADTYVYFVSVLSVQNGTVVDLQQTVDKARKWYCNHVALKACGCCNGDGKRGNVNGETGPVGEIDVSDLTYLISYLFQGGSAPPCEDEANVDGLTGPAGPVDVADLTFVVGFLFLGSSPPPPCP